MISIAIPQNNILLCMNGLKHFPDALFIATNCNYPMQTPPLGPTPWRWGLAMDDDLHFLDTPLLSQDDHGKSLPSVI